MVIKDYADVFTTKYFEDQKSKTLAIIKPDCYNHIGIDLSGSTRYGNHSRKSALLSLRIVLQGKWKKKNREDNQYDPE